MKRVMVVLLAAVVNVVLMQAVQRADATLFDAIRANDVAGVKTRLGAGADPNASADGGVTPLMSAAAFSSPEMMRLLLDAGADTNATNDTGATALMWAAADAAKIRLLLDRGASVNVRNKAGSSALIVAARHQNVEAISTLIARGALADQRPSDASTLAAVAYSRPGTSVLDALKAAGVDPRLPPAPAPPIIFASLTNGVIARRLASAGISAAGQMRLGIGGTTLPVLGLAAFHGHVDLVRGSIEKDADVNAKGSSGVTPLMMAASGDERNQAIVALLIARGARIDQRDANGKTALDWALTRGETTIAGLLRNSGSPEAGPRADRPRPASVSRTPREAIAIALTRLEAGPAFATRFKCISCHHQSLPALAAAVVRARGIVTEPALANHPREATMQVWTPRAERALMGDGLLAIPISDAAYGLWHFAEEGVRPNRVIDSVAVGLATAQGEDGAWRMPDVRPPLADGSSIHFTALAIRGLRHYAPPALRPVMQTRIDRGLNVLRTERPRDTQDEAFKLLGFVWGGAPAGQVGEQAQRVRRLQRPSGGWGQLPTLDPDPYATGQALYALAAGGMPTTNDSFSRGVNYLLRSQLEDGSWFVRSRAFGFQPYSDAGFPHGRDQFISIAATAWATVALAQTLPMEAPRSERLERN